MMLQPPYDIGARISTNSWGAVRTTYTSLDRQVDDFAYLNQDMVIVIAAGNCGDEISGCQYQVPLSVPCSLWLNAEFGLENNCGIEEGSKPVISALQKHSQSRFRVLA